MRLSVAVAVVLASMLGVVLAIATDGPQQLPFHDTPLVIETPSGTFAFQVEVADTSKTRSIGLMHRPAMPQNAGMLFDFETERMVSMWMKNTIIPLDMLFIDRFGGVVRVARNTVPFSTASVLSGAPVRYVLELNAGVTDRLGIRAGAKVRHPVVTDE